jgi:hypothetical protein
VTETDPLLDTGDREPLAILTLSLTFLNQTSNQINCFNTIGGLKEKEKRLQVKETTKN